MKMKLLLQCMLVAALLFHVTPLRAGNEPKDTTPWKITGQLEEACSCDAACPCWFNSKPTKMTCGGGQVLFIDKGNYGNTKLDGLALATMGQSPEGQTMMESFGKWNFAYYYIDKKANPEQRKALEAIAAKVLTPGASKKTETRYALITRTIDGKEHQITIGQYGTFHGHLVEGGMGGAPKIVNPPGADPLHHQYEQGRTTRMTYNDADQNWSWRNSNYMLGSFSIDNVQYEKFAAGLAQKMAGMKNEPSPEKK
ncbi:MAG: hypothetical protein DME20_04555 [Verrucomicrobia bacterium]|nr:MAG: hypothetical protein DME92_05175 [Verrucomicrobiota bacterium]PYK50338.1 MAG: hypothetical protein DME20_04555 [Verrucomicrobiota bacterium]